MSLLDDISNDIKGLNSQTALQQILAQLKIQNKATGKNYMYLSDVLTLPTTTTSISGLPVQLVAFVPMPPVGTPYLDTVSLAWDVNAFNYFKWLITVDSITQGNTNFISFPSFTQAISIFNGVNIPLLTGSVVNFYAYCNGNPAAVNGKAMLYVLANIV